MYLDSESKHRIASLTVYVAWVSLGAYLYGYEGFLRAALGFSLALVCIWFPDAMAGFTESGLGGFRKIDEPSHPTFILYAGWFLLLALPIIIYLITK